MNKSPLFNFYKYLLLSCFNIVFSARTTEVCCDTIGRMWIDNGQALSGRYKIYGKYHLFSLNLHLWNQNILVCIGFCNQIRNRGHVIVIGFSPILAKQQFYAVYKRVGILNQRITRQESRFIEWLWFLFFPCRLCSHK